MRSVQASNLTFGGTLNLSNDSTPSDGPIIAVAGSNVYVAWTNFNSLGNPEVYFAASTNNGSSFGAAVKLSNTAAAADPRIAVSGNSVYLVWQGFNGTNPNEILLRASNNNGASFGSVKNLSNSPGGDSVLPAIAVSGSFVYVAFQDDVSGPSGSTDVFFSNSTNSGQTFHSKLNLSNDKASISPQIAAAGNDVYVAWRDLTSPPDEIYVKSSTNSGNSFAAPSTGINLSKSPTATSFVQQIAATGSNVYVVWQDDTPSSDDVFVGVSTNSGSSFGNPVNLSNNANSINPVVAAVGSESYVAWENHANTSGSTISLRTSGNDGESYTTVVGFGSATGFAELPQIAAIGTNVYLTWQDTTGTNDVFFASSSDNATTFGNVVNLSTNSGSSTVVVVACVGNHAYAAWQDDTQGNDETLFRAGVPVTIVPPTALSSSLYSFENQPVKILLTGSDPQGLPLVFGIVAGPAHGSLGPITQLSSTSAQVTYTPNLNYLGADSLTFKANNESSDSSPATVSITVIAPGPSGGGRWSD